ncbi:MAG: T9SS type A sorting domain-containing protein, partial [Bacteroidia bacterium]
TWTIQSSGAQTGVSVTLQWESAEEETGFVRSAAHLAYWENGVSSVWNNGSLMFASGSGPYTLTRSVDFTTNLFYFGDGSAGSALPVDLTYFSAQWAASATLSNANIDTDTERSRSAVLNWQTATETNNSHFNVERSFDGVAFETIGRVEGMGTTLNPKEYELLDESLESKAQSLKSMGLWTPNLGHQTIYYRLKQIDFDGAFEYSQIRTLNFEQETRNSFSVWPNPSTGAIIKLSKIDNYILTSTNGIVLQKVVATDQINVSNLAFGTYIITSSMGKSVLYIRN